ncbi:interferon alpha/beta receptor 2-like [Latimeria chalumnae]|uniref:interferon alpha/beta receptor 2-like n=1 Tax=Latimeria chalumnae TaxID=7897 RepID=UPI00313B4867
MCVSERLMKLLAILYFQQLAAFASAGLPAPWKVRIESQNFQHLLKWEPGNGTPPETQHKVKCFNINEMDFLKCCSNPTHRTCHLSKKLRALETYMFQVQGSTATEESPWAFSEEFNALRDTTLGPPFSNVTISGKSIWIHLRPSLSEETSRRILKNYIQVKYVINVYQNGSLTPKIEETTSENFTTEIQDVLPNTNYCVSVKLQANTNSNHHPVSSVLQCVQTEVNRAGFLWSPILVTLFVGIVLTGIIVVLAYVGCICTCLIKTLTPKVLHTFTTLSHVITFETIGSPLDQTSAITQIVSKGGKFQVLEDNKQREVDSEENDGYEIHDARAPTNQASLSCQAELSKVEEIPRADTLPEAQNDPAVAHSTIKGDDPVEVPVLPDVLESIVPKPSAQSYSKKCNLSSFTNDNSGDIQLSSVLLMGSCSSQCLISFQDQEPLVVSQEVSTDEEAEERTEQSSLIPLKALEFWSSPPESHVTESNHVNEEDFCDSEEDVDCGYMRR